MKKNSFHGIAAIISQALSSIPFWDSTKKYLKIVGTWKGQNNNHLAAQNAKTKKIIGSGIDKISINLYSKF